MPEWWRRWRAQRQARHAGRVQAVRGQRSSHDERLQARKRRNKDERRAIRNPNPLGSTDPDRDLITRYGDPFD
jgi:hypothetical protein